jgi:hypothetical protein
VGTRSTLEAFDGVELRFLNGAVVRCPAFTVAEATHFIRLLARPAEAQEADDELGAADAVAAFVEAFVLRTGLGSVRLVDLGLAVDAPNGEPVEWGDLTLTDVMAMLEVLHDACWHDDLVKRSKAQVRWLDETPTTFGFDASDLTPAALFGFGHSLTSALYLHVYGLASGFCSRLAMSPRATTWMMGRSQSTSAPGTLT